jgi:hypothetical protein
LQIIRFFGPEGYLLEERPAVIREKSFFRPKKSLAFSALLIHNFNGIRSGSSLIESGNLG